MRIIAIDFDGCICVDRYPDIGPPNGEVIHKAQREKANGAKLILWTCRVDSYLESAVNACLYGGLEFDAVNDNIQESKDKGGDNPRKVGATEYGDDRAVRCCAEEF